MNMTAIKGIYEASLKRFGEMYRSIPAESDHSIIINQIEANLDIIEKHISQKFPDYLFRSVYTIDDMTMYIVYGYVRRATEGNLEPAAKFNAIAIDFKEDKIIPDKLSHNAFVEIIMKINVDTAIYDIEDANITLKPTDNDFIIAALLNDSSKIVDVGAGKLNTKSLAIGVFGDIDSDQAENYQQDIVVASSSAYFDDRGEYGTDIAYTALNGVMTDKAIPAMEDFLDTVALREANPVYTHAGPVDDKGNIFAFKRVRYCVTDEENTTSEITVISLLKNL